MTYPEMRLKYVASLNNEALGEDTDPDYELQYIDIGNVDSSGLIHEVASYRFSDAPSRARRRVRHGDVIVSCVRTYLQAIAPIESPPENLIVSTGFAVVRPLDGLLRAGFCKYALREPRFLAEVERRSVGVSYPAINSSDLAAIPVPTPPDDVQLRIEKFLDHETARIDALIAAKQRVLDLLAEKRKAIIATAVTRGLDRRVKLRDSGVPWLGEIPAHWGVVQSRRLFRVRNEPARPSDRQLTASQKYGMLPQSEFVELEGRRVVELEKGVDSLRHVEPDDFVISLRSFQGGLEWSKLSGSVTFHYVVLVPIKWVHPPYFAHLFKSLPFIEALRSTATLIRDGQDLRFSHFTLVDLPIVPLEEQRLIAAHLDRETAKLDAVRAATERSIGLLKERRSALIAAAVTGQLDLGAAT